MSKKAGAVDSITLTGGCAKNDGLKEAIEKVLNLKVIDLPIDPQLMGALGAAEFARQREWQRKERFNMATFLHVILIIAIVLVCLFVLSFIVYFFNLDMKLTAAIEPLMQKALR